MSFFRQVKIPSESKTKEEAKIITVGKALPADGVVAVETGAPIRTVGVAVGVVPVKGEIVKVGVGVAVGLVGNWAETEETVKTKRKAKMAIIKSGDLIFIFLITITRKKIFVKTPVWRQELCR